MTPNYHFCDGEVWRKVAELDNADTPRIGPALDVSWRSTSPNIYGSDETWFGELLGKILPEDVKTTYTYLQALVLSFHMVANHLADDDQPTMVGKLFWQHT